MSYVHKFIYIHLFRSMIVVGCLVREGLTRLLCLSLVWIETRGRTEYLRLQSRSLQRCLSLPYRRPHDLTVPGVAVGRQKTALLGSRGSGREVLTALPVDDALVVNDHIGRGSVEAALVHKPGHTLLLTFLPFVPED